ncbi:MAG TPA: hypothetical protein VLL54_21360 [Pyrinomonadaceae bacterium]|nr:hypothetical protein [Pyrinomonadaceae bacterium]
MKQKAWFTSLTTLALVVVCVLGCSKTGSVATSTPSNTNSATTPTTPADISGDYTVAGANEDGSPYKGELAVIKHGDVYQFRWNAGKQYDGIGISNGNVVAVSFTGGANGQGCGVVTYKVGADGSLDGRWGMWGKDESGTEKGTRTSGSDLAGDYNTNGTNPNGTTYKGRLTVAQLAGGYSFVWSNPTATGFGIRQGDFVSVGFGGPRCAFVAYEVKPDGILDGVWGGYGSSKTGTEKATKK